MVLDNHLPEGLRGVAFHEERLALSGYVELQLGDGTTFLDVDGGITAVEEIEDARHACFGEPATIVGVNEMPFATLSGDDERGLFHGERRQRWVSVGPGVERFHNAAIVAKYSLLTHGRLVQRFEADGGGGGGHIGVQECVPVGMRQHIGRDRRAQGG